MKRVDEMVGKALGRGDVLRHAQAQRALRHWGDIVGPVLAAKSRPERYDRGTVWVAVEGSSWAQELRMMRDVILERLREVAQDPHLFQKLRFGVRTLPKEAAPPSTEPELAPDRAVVEWVDTRSIRQIVEDRLRKMERSE